jgi:DNA-directed RNA polymerase specialized sigma24 family protein
VAKEQRRELERAIAALPASAREVVVLYYREGQSARQVADLLGIGEVAVRQRLSRTRGRLREALATQIRDAAPTAACTAVVMAALSAAGRRRRQRPP